MAPWTKTRSVLYCKEGMIQYEANYENCENFENFEDTPRPASVTGIQARTALSLTCENLHNMKDDLYYEYLGMFFLQPWLLNVYNVACTTRRLLYRETSTRYRTKLQKFREEVPDSAWLGLENVRAHAGRNDARMTLRTIDNHSGSCLVF